MTFQSIDYCNNLWIAAGDNAVLRTSTDAVTWVTQNLNITVGISTVVYGNNLWVVGAFLGILRTANSAGLPNLNFGNNVYGWIKK